MPPFLVRAIVVVAVGHRIVVVLMCVPVGTVLELVAVCVVMRDVIVVVAVDNGIMGMLGLASYAFRPLLLHRDLRSETIICRSQRGAQSLCHAGTAEEASCSIRT